ncbi:hypothetical protein K5549_015541 [Capra hircus]|nr:hypothetical protein K5549_015541 [Capra hircus]
MYSSSSRTRCRPVAAPASLAARFLRGPDAAGSSWERAGGPGDAIAIPATPGRRRRGGAGAGRARCAGA